MMLFKGRVSFPRLDVESYTEAMEAIVRTQMRQAAREWLRAVIPRVPVWTGMARGTLQPLGRFLKVAVPIHPVAVRPGMGPGVGARKSHFSFPERDHRFYFQWSTDVFHFIQNEFYQAPNPPFRLRHPTPWNAILAGKAAFDRYVAEVLPGRLRRVRLRDHLRFTSQRYGPP
jgi:hypothetical protein